MFAISRTTTIRAFAAIALLLIAGAGLAVDRPVIDLGRLGAAQTAAIFGNGCPANSTVKIPAGYHLPLTLAASGNVAHTQDPVPAITLVAIHDLYLRVQSDTFEVSFDGITYRPAKDVFHGLLSFGVSAAGTPAQLHADLTARLVAQPITPVP